MQLFLDLETRSEADLKSIGSWCYSLDESTEILCISVAIDAQEPIVMSPGKFTSWYREVTGGQTVTLIAHNARFEYAIWNHVGVRQYDWPPAPLALWECTAAQAAYFALPRSLEKTAKALNLAQQKDEQGSRIMLQLCKPRKPSKDNPDTYWEKDKYPEKFEVLYKYCKQDVATSQAIRNALPPLPKKEKAIYRLDQIINNRGVLVDTASIKKVLGLITQHTENLCLRVKELTNGELESTNQVAKLLALAKSKGEQLEDLTKATVDKVLSDKLIKDPAIKELLQIRQSLAKSSTAKYKRMLSQASPRDDRIRGLLKYCGANTGRWTGNGLQPQNLPRDVVDDPFRAIHDIRSHSYIQLKTKHGDLFKFFSSCIRPMIQAKDGHSLVIADFASIEARVLAWLAGCDTASDAFKQKKDVYKQMASSIYGIPESDITKEQRHLGKAAVLGCGYGMGAPKFKETCASQGLHISDELALKAKHAYRTTYKEIPVLWKDTEFAALQAVVETTPSNTANLVFSTHSVANMWFGMHKDFLMCKLPSGRNISYHKPEVVSYEDPYGRERRRLHYWREAQGAYVKADTYGGKLVENICQAVARDIMAEAMLRLEAAGYPIILTVHDEVVAEVPDDEINTDKFRGLMIATPEWATGCPLDSEVIVSKYYGK